MRFAFVVAGFVAAMAFGPAAGQARAQSAASGSGLCKVGQQVEYVKESRRWPGRVDGDNGKNCIVYTKRYMGAIDVPYGDLRPASGATDEFGKPDVPAASKAMITATPKEVIDLFQRDPDAAKARFNGTPIRFTGTADSIDATSIWFKLNNYQSAAKCLVEPQDRAALREVKDRAMTTVEGVAFPWGNDAITIQNCKITRQVAAPVTTLPARPPLGRYFCMNAGRGLGYVTYAASTYTVDGVTGGYSYNPATKRFTFTGGSYPKWGWTAQWRTDPASPTGPPEPRIDMTDGKSLHIMCFPRP